MKKQKTTPMKYLFVFILSLLLTNGFSQVWIDSSAKWTFDYFNVSEYGTWQFDYTHDSIIQGHQVQVIEATKHRYYSSSGYISSFSQGNYYTYASNDSVFYFKNGQFFLLYDFGAQIGDSWIISIDSNSPCSSTATVRVTDTGSTNINGQLLRTITLKTDTNSFYALNGLCIERFGIMPTTYEDNNLGFMPGYQNCGNFVVDYDLLTFRCYSDKSFSTYNPSGKNCDTLTNVIEFKKQNLNLYPNPTAKFLNIDLPVSDISQIEIIDLNGKTILIFRKENNLDLSKLEKGMYFIRISTSDNNIITKPFIKE